MKGSTLSSTGGSGARSRWEVNVVSDPIADLRSPRGALISLYVERPSPGGFAAQLSDLVKPLRKRAESLNREVQKSVREDAERIHDLAGRLEVDSAPAFAVFASSIDDVFLMEPLSHGVDNVAVLGPRPYMRPLRAAPRAVRSGVIVADRALGRSFVAFGGLVEELGQPMEADIGKSNYGGFSGYAEHGVRSHADEATARMWKDLGVRLLEEHKRRAFDYVAIGGHEETVDEIARYLHPYLARLPRAEFVASPHDVTPATLRAAITANDVSVRHRRQEAMAGAVCDTAWSGGNAVLGMTSTLQAVNAQAVETLVVAGPFTRSGSICSECGHLSREASQCPVCESAMFHVDDIVASAMETAVAAGGAVHQIEVPSPLDVEGIGALTRFPIHH